MLRYFIGLFLGGVIGGMIATLEIVKIVETTRTFTLEHDLMIGVGVLVGSALGVAIQFAVTWMVRKVLQ